MSTRRAVSFFGFVRFVNFNSSLVSCDVFLCLILSYLIIGFSDLKSLDAYSLNGRVSELLCCVLFKLHIC